MYMNEPGTSRYVHPANIQIHLNSLISLGFYLEETLKPCLNIEHPSDQTAEMQSNLSLQWVQTPTCISCMDSEGDRRFL